MAEFVLRQSVRHQIEHDERVTSSWDRSSFSLAACSEGATLSSRFPGPVNRPDSRPCTEPHTFQNVTVNKVLLLGTLVETLLERRRRLQVDRQLARGRRLRGVSGCARLGGSCRS